MDEEKKQIPLTLITICFALGMIFTTIYFYQLEIPNMEKQATNQCNEFIRQSCENNAIKLTCEELTQQTISIKTTE